MEKLNIIFMHKGDSWYLSYALNQVRKSNPDADIILLGDETNAKYNEIVKHYFISDYFKGASDFAVIYQHFSTQSYDFELFCIQRWFIWLEFMKAHNLTLAMFPDTDVLIFQDVNKYISKITGNYQYSRGQTNHMGFVFFSSIVYLEKVCQYITTQYENPEIIKELEVIAKNYIVESKWGGGISDITLFERYEAVNMDCAFNFEIPPRNGMAFINSLDSPYYKHNCHKMVDIKWNKGIPYATMLNGDKVSIIGVHCFGLQKRFIRKLYQGNGKWKARLIYLWKESYSKKILNYLRRKKK